MWISDQGSPPAPEVEKILSKSLLKKDSTDTVTLIMQMFLYMVNFITL